MLNEKTRTGNLTKRTGGTDMDSKIISGMTGREVLDALRADTPLARIARVFSDGYAEIDQAARQRRPASPIEIRRMELQAANRIASLFGIGLE